jgi:hypothetical protein
LVGHDIFSHVESWPSISRRDIFVSRPSTRNKSQEEFLEHLDGLLEQRELRPVVIGQTEYPNRAPINAVRDRMESCEGAIILGLEQLHVVDGRDKPGSDSEGHVEDLHLSTPWNHIEVGMAFMLGLPMLIINEEGVESGVFDVGNSDRFIHQAAMTTD